MLEALLTIVIVGVFLWLAPVILAVILAVLFSLTVMAGVVLFLFASAYRKIAERVKAP